jgi:hypothetical protein
VLLWHVQVLYELPKGVEVPPTAAAGVTRGSLSRTVKAARAAMGDSAVGDC